MGGLFGTATSGTIVLDNVAVTLAGLSGYYNIGGLFGSITGGANVSTQTAAAVNQVGNISFAKELADNAVDMNCGKIGKLVGSIGGSSSKLTLGAKATKGSWSKKALGYNFNRKLKAGTTDWEYFVGSGTYVGYSPVITGDESYKNGTTFVTKAALNAYGEANQ